MCVDKTVSMSFQNMDNAGSPSTLLQCGLHLKFRFIAISSPQLEKTGCDLIGTRRFGLDCCFYFANFDLFLYTQYPRHIHMINTCGKCSSLLPRNWNTSLLKTNKISRNTIKSTVHSLFCAAILNIGGAQLEKQCMYFSTFSSHCYRVCQDLIALYSTLCSFKT